MVGEAGMVAAVAFLVTGLVGMMGLLTVYVARMAKHVSRLADATEALARKGEDAASHEEADEYELTTA